MEFIKQLTNNINNIPNLDLTEDNHFQLIDVSLLINQPNENKEMRECEYNEEIKNRVFRKHVKYRVLQHNQ